MACLRGDSYQADEHDVDLTATEAVVTTAPDLQEEVPTEEGVKGRRRFQRRKESRGKKERDIEASRIQELELSPPLTCLLELAARAPRASGG